MLKKVTLIDRIEIDENGSLQVRTKTRVMEDGNQISSTFNWHIINPGDDCSNNDARVQAICAIVHTPDVIAAYKASVAQPEESAA